jgi:hypothetical protein
MSNRVSYRLTARQCAVAHISVVTLAVLFAVASVWLKVGPVASALVYGPVCAWFLAAILRRAGLPWTTIGLMVLGLGVYIYYLLRTPYDVRNFDGPAHVQYIEYLLRNGSLPKESDCSICHHPPAYHILAAGVFAFCARTGLAEPTKGLQVFSLGLWLVFVSFAALTVRWLLRRPYQQVLATALVVFWPYSIISSVRVNNDTLACALASMTCYFLVRWYPAPRFCWLLGACSCAALGLATKTNALVLVVLIVAVAILRIASLRARRRLARSLAPALALLLAVAAGHAFVRGAHGSHVIHNLLGTAYLRQGVAGVRPPTRYYLRFDFESLVNRPFADIFLGTREPTYWNHLIKSSLFGTRGAGRGPAGTLYPSTKIAAAMNYLLLPLAAFSAVGLMVGRRNRRAPRLLCSVMVAVWVAGGLIFHWIAPDGYHADFRFILPVLVPMSALYAWGLEGFRKPVVLVRCVPISLACAFLSLSIASFFFMGPDPPRGIRLFGISEISSPKAVQSAAPAPGSPDPP